MPLPWQTGSGSEPDQANGEASALEALTGETGDGLVAIIDIGSNSVRLVIFEGYTRVPATVFNEKVLCGLGAEVGRTGRMGEDAIARALATLTRFAHICAGLSLADVHVIATAAVREATNGAQFAEMVEAITGFRVNVITGEREAELSALGVIAGIPRACGVVGDLGGGSLELAPVDNTQVFGAISLKIGPVRLIGEHETEKAIDRAIEDAMASVPWWSDVSGQPLYLVGGAWRALAKLHMEETAFPLPIIHEYEVPGNDIETLCSFVINASEKDLLAFRRVPEKRVPALPVAAKVLRAVARASKANSLIVSSLGLREGILFDGLDPVTRQQDPLISQCRILAQQFGHLIAGEDTLMKWIDPLFVNEKENDRRLRYAVSILNDIAWRGHPDFRAEQALDLSLLGWFSGLDARGRAILGLALFVAYGGGIQHRAADLARSVLRLPDIDYAARIGLAVRLAKRLMGGAIRPLSLSALRVDSDALTLEIDESFSPLIGEVVERRLNSLARHIGVEPQVRTREPLGQPESLQAISER
ncbi:MAG: Ppx/GppA family phosphatase [Pseudomonadota bacterium]